MPGSRRGGCLVLGGAWSWGVPGPGGYLVPGGPGGDPPPNPPLPEMATAAGGTHPTGMHSCLIYEV